MPLWIRGGSCYLWSWQHVYRCLPGTAKKKKTKHPRSFQSKQLILKILHQFTPGTTNKVGSSFSKKKMGGKKDLCGEFTEGTLWEHSASIRSQSIIDGHVNILWGRAMEKMTREHTHADTQRPSGADSRATRADIPHSHCRGGRRAGPSNIHVGS